MLIVTRLLTYTRPCDLVAKSFQFNNQTVLNQPAARLIDQEVIRVVCFV